LGPAKLGRNFGVLLIPPMAIQPLQIPIRSYGENTPVAPDTNAEVDKINEIIAAVNAGLATSNAIVGGDKYVRYLSSQTYGVPADALTLDRLDMATVLPGTTCTVINPHPTPLTATAASTYYRATIVPAGTADAVLVPAFTGSTDTVPVVWLEIVNNDTFTPLLKNEFALGKDAYVGLELRPLLIALVNGIGTGSSTVVTQPPTTQPTTGPTVTGFLPDSAEIGASITLTGTGFTKATAVLFNGTPASFQLLNATSLIAVVPPGATTGPVAVTNSAGTGTSAASFTVKAAVIVTPPTPSPALTAALAISVASIVAGNPLTFTVTAGGGTAPYGYAVVATNNATGATTILGSSATGSFTPQAGGTSYNIDATVTDAAGKVAQATTRTVTVTAQQSVNQMPVANAGDDLTITAPTSSVVLSGAASDPDPGDSLTYLWRPIAGPNTPVGLPATTLNVVVSNLLPGTYQFGFQATDQKGGKSPEDFVVVTVNAAPVGLTLSAPNPASGLVGSSVTLSGTKLSGATGYAFNGVVGAASLITNNTDTSITLVVPQGATSGNITVATPSGTATSSSAFTVTLPPTGPDDPTILKLTSTDFGLNAYPNIADSVGVPKRSAFSVLHFETNATQVRPYVVSRVAQIGFADADALISVYSSDWTFIAAIKPAQSGDEQALPAIALPGSGTRNYYLVESGNSAGDQPGGFWGGSVTKIQRVNGGLLNVLPPKKAKNILVIDHDSIGSGDGSTNNSRYSWIMRLRFLLGGDWDVISMGWGAASLGASYSTSLQQQEAANRVLACYSGYTGRKAFIQARGTNDYGLNTSSPAQAGQIAGSIFDLIHAGSATAEIYSATPFWRGGKENSNSRGNLQDYANALNNAALARNFVTPIDCLPWLSEPDFVQTESGAQGQDNLHPSDAGHFKVAQRWFGVITGRAIAAFAEVGEVLQEDDPRISYTPDDNWRRNNQPNFGAYFRRGSIRFTSTAGAYASIPTQGRQIQLRTYTEPAGGEIEIVFGGVVIDTFSLGSSPVKNYILLPLALCPLAIITRFKSGARAVWSGWMRC
jgi:hypothetical protein